MAGPSDASSHDGHPTDSKTSTNTVSESRVATLEQEYGTLKEENDTLKNELVTTDERLKILEEAQINDKGLQKYADLARSNDDLSVQVESLTMLVKQLTSIQQSLISTPRGLPVVGGNPTFDTIEATSGTIGGWHIVPTGIFGDFLGGDYQVVMDSGNKRIAVQDHGGTPVAVLGFLNGLPKPGGGAYGGTDVGVWADLGAIANWMISQNEIVSGPNGTARLSIDSSKLRFRVIDSLDAEKVAMGYLGGLPIQGTTWSSTKTYAIGEYVNDGVHVYKSLQNGNTGNTPAFPGPTAWWAVSTDNWTNANYGFWAKIGDRVVVDGTMDFQNGNQLINNDASFIVMSGGTPIARLGTLNGTKGLFLSEANINIASPLSGIGFQTILTANQLLIGDPSNQYIRWFNGQLTISGQIQSSNFLAGSAGWKLSQDGTAEFYGALKVSSIKSSSLIIYTGLFTDLIAGGIVTGITLPAGGHVYYLESSLLNEVGANAWTVDIGAAAYAAPSKYGDTSLAPAANFLAHLTLPFTGTATAEGWVIVGSVSAQILFRIYDPVTQLFLSLNYNTANSMGAYFPTSYFLSGQGYDGTDVRSLIYWNINGTIYNGLNSVVGWLFFSISTSGFFIGNGSNTVYQALAVPGNANTLAYLLGVAGIQFSNVMISTGHSSSMTEMIASFGSAQPYGQLVSSAIIALQSAGGVKFPSLAADPPVVNGAVYYNTIDNLLKACYGGAWNYLDGVYGTAASGAYLKLPDGTLIEWGNVTNDTASAGVSNYFGSTSGALNFDDTPITFPLAFLGGTLPSVATGQMSNITHCSPLSINATGFTLRFLDSSPFAINSKTATWMAIGRWK